MITLLSSGKLVKAVMILFLPNLHNDHLSKWLLGTIRDGVYLKCIFFKLYVCAVIYVYNTDPHTGAAKLKMVTDTQQNGVMA